MKPQRAGCYMGNRHRVSVSVRLPAVTARRGCTPRATRGGAPGWRLRAADARTDPSVRRAHRSAARPPPTLVAHRSAQVQSRPSPARGLHRRDCAVRRLLTIALLLLIVALTPVAASAARSGGATRPLQQVPATTTAPPAPTQTTVAPAPPTSTTTAPTTTRPVRSTRTTRPAAVPDAPRTTAVARTTRPTEEAAGRASATNVPPGRRSSTTQPFTLEPPPAPPVLDSFSMEPGSMEPGSMEPGSTAAPAVHRPATDRFALPLS